MCSFVIGNQEGVWFRGFPVRMLGVEDHQCNSETQQDPEYQSSRYYCLGGGGGVTVHSIQHLKCLLQNAELGLYFLKTVIISLQIPKIGDICTLLGDTCLKEFDLYHWDVQVPPPNRPTHTHKYHCTCPPLFFLKHISRELVVSFSNITNASAS